MTSFEVVLVPFPFADLSSAKRRPCLVLCSYKPRALREHVILAMMTSQLSGPHFPHDVDIQHLASAGLPKPTRIRLSKLVTLDSQLVIKTLGSIHPQDRERIRAEFSKLFRAVL